MSTLHTTVQAIIQWPSQQNAPGKGGKKQQSNLIEQQLKRNKRPLNISREKKKVKQVFMLLLLTHLQ